MIQILEILAGHRLWDNKINASKGDDQLTGNGGADKFSMVKEKKDINKSPNTIIAYIFIRLSCFLS